MNEIKKLTPEVIAHEVGEYFKCSLNDDTRKRKVVRSRWIYYKLCKKLCYMYSQEYCAGVINQNQPMYTRGLKEFVDECGFNKEFLRYYNDILTEIQTSDYVVFTENIADLNQESLNKVSEILKQKNNEILKIIQNKENYI